jgi:hypothetical protein
VVDVEGAFIREVELCCRETGLREVERGCACCEEEKDGLKHDDQRVEVVHLHEKVDGYVLKSRSKVKMTRRKER